MIKIEDVKEICEGLFHTAAQIVESQEELAPVAFIFREEADGLAFGIVPIPEFTDETKTRLPFMLKKVAISTGADIMVFMSEAWALSATKQQLNKRVSEHDEKYDALIMVVQVKGGDTFSLMAKVKTESGIRSVSKPDWTHSAVTTLIFDWAESVVSH